MSSAAKEIIYEEQQAKRLRPADLPALVAREGVQLVSVDAPPAVLATSARTLGVVELPAPKSNVPSLPELVADRVLERLRAAGAITPSTITNMTPAVPPDAGATKILYVDLAEAAIRLGTTKEAMKKYLARHQRRDGRDTVCALGDDVRAVKVRGRWRVRFPDDEVR